MSSLRRSGLRAALIAGALLAACGGGGSGDSQSGGGGGLSISPASLSFSRVDGAIAPEGKEIVATVSSSEAAYIVAGYPAGTTEPAWLALSMSGSGQTWRIRASITDAVMAPGTYSATIRVVIARADQSIITHRDAQVTYTVAPGLAGRPNWLALSKVLGSSEAYGDTASFDVSGTAGLSFTASADQPWLRLSATAGLVPTRITVSVDEAGLAPGTHTARITILGGPAPSTVDVTLTLTEPSFNGNGTLTLSGTAGVGTLTTTDWVMLSVGTNAYSWTASGVPSWLQVSPASGTVSSSWVPITFTIDSATLPPGTYTADVSLAADVLGVPVERPITVTCTLAAPALTAPASVALGGASGHDLAPAPFQLRLATGTSAFGFTATTATAWATVSPASGSVSATAADLTVTPDLAAVAALPAGTYASTVEVSVDVNGGAVTASIPLTLTLDDHVLLLSEEGVAFSKLPSASVLSRSVLVRSNRGLETDWVATSDRSWLDVTPSGTTGGALVLTASPAGLSADALHEATVTVSSSDPTIVGTRAIRVGLWIGSTNPSDVSLPLAYTHLAADPVRPYLYATAGGADVTVFDVFSGAVVRTIAGLGTTLRALAVSGDGSRLFVVDDGRHVIVPVDLATDGAATPWTLGAGIARSNVVHARPGGASVVLASDGAVRDAATGETLGTFFGNGGYDGLVLAAARDGSRVCFASPSCMTLDYTSTLDQVLVGAPRGGGGGVRSNPRDVAISADGTRVFGAQGHPYVFTAFDATGDGLMAALPDLPANAYPNAVAVGADGRIYGAADAWYGPTDLWVYDATGSLVASYYVSGYAKSIRDRGVAVSGDGLRMMVVTDDPTLQFLSTPP